MRYVGYNENFHDAGIAILDLDGNIIHASHAERYIKRKNYYINSPEQWALVNDDDHVVYYEDPYLRLKHFTEHRIINIKNKLDQQNAFLRLMPDTMTFDSYKTHHESHAAVGFYTRPWEDTEDTVILTIDGHGEIESSCIFDSKLNKVDFTEWPQSIGGIYAQVTQALKLTPLEEEYIVMGLSSYGEPDPRIVEELEDIYNTCEIENDMYGRVKYCVYDMGASNETMAASVQRWAEDKIYERALEARKYGSKLIYSGGVAQNIVANSKIRDLFDDMWIPPAVTDAGSALGCAAMTWGEATGKTRINWESPYLGYNIERDINPREVVDHILKHQYCGIANGKAEWGPRALGNRSLIADVRYDVKDTVNTIKRRQMYRPFAPAILEEFADQYFEGHMGEYMQYTAKALHDYSSVTHVDGTARVQIVKKDCKSVFRQVIEEYYERTGVPMLLNTSLNIRGMPIVNDEQDAKLFEKKYNVKVF